ncbi:14 kDa proline-rich protein DC2.15 [Cajanus cajan]|uniref:14 kDa proline-rich protein DC2.15 n=1 Tax=Cajanus cajan TaxID=3821 RepID=A0A151R549_CAJCA|nr:14 kDa proline-rich protein DC2.15 [Cajanus cajan]KYP37667.1 14 kDa proline-rich protein DC2.15 [Cajanus cajan]
MKSSRSSTLALFFTINLLFFVMASGCFTCTQPKPTPNTFPFPNPSPATKSCPRDALKLGVCANVLNGPIGAVVGSPPDHPCCSVLEGLLDLEVAVCLCTAIKANILGINLNIPISLSLILNACEKSPPSDFLCN